MEENGLGQGPTAELFEQVHEYSWPAYKLSAIGKLT
jgi:hypothetical protein